MRVQSANRCLAVIGTAKHAGKTTALNRLIEGSLASGHTTGICSIGRDGESTDSIHNLDKPAVICRSGQFVISTRAALHAATCDLTYLEIVGPETPRGRLQLVRCESDGRVILEGVQSASSLEAATRALHARGARLVLVDGAFGRVMATGAETTDDVVLAVGAVSGDTAEDIADHLVPYLRQLQLPEIPENTGGGDQSRGWRRALLAEAMSADAVALGGPHSAVRLLETESALLGLNSGTASKTHPHSAVAIPGAITNGVVEHLLDSPTMNVSSDGPRPWLLVPDASRFKLDADSWTELRESYRIAVGRAVQLRAVAINPRRPDGTSIKTSELRGAIKRAMLRTGTRPCPVWDPRTSVRIPVRRIGTDDGVGDNVSGATA